MIKILTLVFFASLFTACSSYKIKRDAVEQIKKVAVVSFHLADVSNLSNERKEILASHGESVWVAPEKDKADPRAYRFSVITTPASEAIFETFVNTLNKQLNWKSPSLDEIKSNPAYDTLYRNARGAALTVIDEPGDYPRYRPDGLGDVNKILFMSTDERDQLMDKLNVDALVVSQVNVYMTGPDIGLMPAVNMDLGNGYIAKHYINNRSGGVTLTNVDTSNLSIDAVLKIWIYGKSHSDPILRSINITAEVPRHFELADLATPKAKNLKLSEKILAMAAQSSALEFKKAFSENRIQ